MNIWDLKLIKGPELDDARKPYPILYMRLER